MGEGRVGVEPHDGVPGSGEWGAAGTVGKWAPIGDDGSFRERATALLRRVYGVAVAPVRSADHGIPRPRHDRGRRALPRPLPTRREGARDPGATARRRRAHRAGRRAARGGLAGRRARRGGALARGPGGEPALVPRAGPGPRRAVLAARARGPGLPPRDRGRPARRQPLRAERARGDRARARRRRWRRSTRRSSCGAGRRSATSPTPTGRSPSGAGSRTCARRRRRSAPARSSRSAGRSRRSRSCAG